MNRLPRLSRRPPPAPSHRGLGDPSPFFLPGNKTGVLLIHGWSGSPAEMRGLGLHLAEAGYTVSGVRLPGHGGDAEVLLRTGWQSWASACGQAISDLRRRCDRVFVGGLSMGGILSLYLGATARPVLDGVISMGSPIYYTDWRMAALPVLKYVRRWYTKSGPSDLRDPSAGDRLWHYSRLPSNSIHQLTLVSREARRLLPRQDVPLLVMQGRHDRTIAPGCAAYIYAHAAAQDKQLVFYENSGHGITEDLDRAEVWARVLRFVREHGGE